MSRVVYTYTSLRDLKSHKKYDEISACPHITANRFLAESMEAEFGTDIHEISGVNSVISSFVPGWKGTGAEFARYTDLSRVVRDIRNVSPDEQKICEAFIKNKSEVLRSIEQLTEMNISALDIDPKNSEEKIFQAVWEKLEEENDAMGRFRTTMCRLSSEKSFFIETVDKIIKDEEDVKQKAFFRKLKDADAVVLHGFFYITPIQERFFEILENSGKQLVFLCCVDSNCPEVARVWGECLSEENGFPSMKDWLYDGNGDNSAAAFATLFEANAVKYKTPLTPVKVYEYSSEAAFLTDVKRITQSGYQLFSPDVKATEKIIRQVYPDKFGRKHLLSYPVGQYIYYLHSMWNKNAPTPRVELSFDGIVACFSSGWISVDGHNGRDYVSDLLKLKEVVRGCASSDEWRDRLGKLSEFRDSVLSKFEVGVSATDKESARMHKLMGNPFLNFSCYSVSKDSLDVIYSLINQLCKTAEYLFESSREIDIAEHINKLEKILKKAPEDGNLFEEERQIVDEIIAELRAPMTKLHNCLPEDITEAVMLAVGGGFENSESIEGQQDNGSDFVIPYLCIEGSVKKDSKVHICLADETRIPRGVSTYSWPLTDAMIDALALKLPKENGRYIRDYKFVNGSSKLSNRYLMYCALQNPDIEISWIAEENDKEIGPSPYISVLRDVYGIKPVKVGATSYTKDAMASVTAYESMPLSIGKDELVAREELLDFDYCPFRYLYGYVLNEQPTYKSGFHYNFVMSALIGSIARLTGIPKENVGEHVFEGFPYLRKVEQKQIVDFATVAYDDGGTDFVGDASYTNLRLNAHMIPASKLKETLSEIGDPSFAPKPIDLRTEMGKTRGDCMYCPFSDECPHSKRMEDEE